MLGAPPFPPTLSLRGPFLRSTLEPGPVLSARAAAPPRTPDRALSRIAAPEEEGGSWASADTAAAEPLFGASPAVSFVAADPERDDFPLPDTNSMMLRAADVDRPFVVGPDEVEDAEPRLEWPPVTAVMGGARASTTDLFRAAAAVGAAS